jgi:DNA-binding NtrC family response regulator
MQVKPSILVVDDEAGQRQFLRAVLEKEFDIVTAADGQEATQLLESKAFDLVITDQQMPRMSGIELITWAREHVPEIPIIVLTAYGTIQTAVEAMKLGAQEYLNKPLQSPEELRLTVARTLRHKSLKDKDLVHRQDKDEEFPAEVVAESAQMKQVLHLASQVASQPTTALLTGESGTGKEIIARFIHRRSPRSEGPFVAVNCAALTESLLESELFGHERGAFTGATQMKRGRFELAQGGTLLLDEIGEMGFSLQSKLLRVLQGHQFERVGGTRTITVDVRVIASTNQNLPTAIKENRFREDLYYRLNVFPIEIPPLRERREDILPLAEFFINKISRRMGRPPQKPSEAAERILYSYHWPGNTRELENAIERALIVSQSERIELQDLPLQPLPESAITGPNPTLAEIEKSAILRTLEQNQGDRQSTAQSLGISLRKLQYRLKEYGLAGKRQSRS